MTDMGVNICSSDDGAEIEIDFIYHLVAGYRAWMGTIIIKVVQLYSSTYSVHGHSKR